MARLKIKLNHRGVRAMLRSADVQRVVEDRAEKIARAAGPGMKHEATVGRDRAIAMVWTDTTEARRAEAKHRTLTRAIDAAR